jgi:hypothetical protein
VSNKMVTTKTGEKIAICNYHYVDHDGEVFDCHSPAACPICGQCSKLVGDHENGHCPGHSGLMAHIPCPGRDMRPVNQQKEK